MAFGWLWLLISHIEDYCNERCFLKIDSSVFLGINCQTLNNVFAFLLFERKSELSTHISFSTIFLLSHFFHYGHTLDSTRI